jgi:hypothetical protein
MGSGSSKHNSTPTAAVDPFKRGRVETHLAAVNTDDWSRVRGDGVDDVTGMARMRGELRNRPKPEFGAGQGQQHASTVGVLHLTSLSQKRLCPSWLWAKVT